MSDQPMKLELWAIPEEGGFVGIICPEGLDPDGRTWMAIRRTEGTYYREGRPFDTPEEVAIAIQEMLADLRHGKVGR